MSKAGEKVSLDTFLSDLSTEDAAQVRVAAAEIDNLARIGHAMGAIEDRFRPFAIVSGVAFVIGLVLFFMPDLVNRWLSFVCLIALPVLCAIYAWKTRERTWADSDIEKLNKFFFLPNGGIYFAASETPAGVVRVKYTPPPPEPPPGTYPKDPRKPENHPASRW